MPDRDLLSMLERLMGDEPGLLSMWSRMVAQIIENKANSGLAHLSDQEVADNAAGIFHGLIKLCVEARHDPSKAHRLQAFGWFLDACRAERSKASRNCRRSTDEFIDRI
jgi:hypothetical protein